MNYAEEATQWTPVDRRIEQNISGESKYPPNSHFTRLNKHRLIERDLGKIMLLKYLSKIILLSYRGEDDY